VKRCTILFTICLLSFQYAFSQEDVNVKPGIDRWSVKTSIGTGKSKNVELSDLLNLPLLDPQYNATTYATTLIPQVQTGNIKEGDIITTTGYLCLVALEDASATKEDGDYHIQLTLSDQSADSCFIVEIPYSQFITDPTLKDSAEGRRAFIRQRLLKGKEPSISGSVMQSSVYVKVTGQLFYDAIHAAQMRGPKPMYRGKKGMHSYTAWELHPVMDIEFAKP
jgi:hypothetical protein